MEETGGTRKAEEGTVSIAVVDVVGRTVVAFAHTAVVLV